MRLLPHLLLLLLTGRLLLLACILEPTNDEGLWQWNARCEQWSLPAHGIVHSALSPVNHWLNRVLFAITGPGITPKRLLNALLVAAAVGYAVRRLLRERHAQGALVFLAWVGFDPYLFRMGSWAILEPLLLAGIVAWHLRDTVNPTVWKSFVAGMLVGLLVGVKITVVWIPLGLAVAHLVRREFRQMAAFLSAVLLVACAFYASVWLVSDQQRFAEIWHLHTSGRTRVAASLLGLFQGVPDPRILFYTSTALLMVSYRLWHWLRFGTGLSTASYAVGMGLLMVATQAYRPERYLFPIALLAMLDLSRSACIKAAPKHLVHLILVLAVAVNAVWWHRFVSVPFNAGGWDIHGRLQAAAADHLRIAAPPHLALGIEAPVYPTSCGSLTVRETSFQPDVLVIQVVAAEVTSFDEQLAANMNQRGATFQKAGFYVEYRVSGSLPLDRRGSGSGVDP